MSRDLLRRFGGGISSMEQQDMTGAGNSDENELSLGLSLGGNLVGPKKIVRSSSVAAFPVFAKEEAFVPSAAPLARTSSLPSETGEEMQCLKRKRTEKRDAGGGGKVGRVDIEIDGCSVDKAACFLPGSQSSIGSSNSSDVENLQNQGFDSSRFISSTETKSLLRIQSLPGCMEKTMMEEMPCVSTAGEGPDGRRIEGFLYNYRKGEEVRIVCVCHGRFLTPAEFVKHAGGSDVAHPLRHIVVSPSPSALLL